MTAAKGKARKKQQKRRTRYLVHLADGTVATVKRRRKARKREKPEDVLSRHQAIKLVTAEPLAYRLFDNIPLDPGPQGGRTRTYPNELYSVLFCLRDVYPHTRELVREISCNPAELKMVLNGVLKNMRAEDRSAFRAAIRAGQFPVESSVLRTWEDYADIDAMRAALRRYAAEIALEAGRFDRNRPNRLSIPQWEDILFGDGTVLKSNNDNTSAVNLDPKTGEIYEVPMDQSVREHREGGKDTPVQGTKAVISASRGHQYGDLVIHDVAMTDSTDPTSEADLALDMFDHIHQALAAAAAKRGTDMTVLGFGYDGAGIGPHAARLVPYGTFLVNSPPAKETDIDPVTGERIRVAEHVYEMQVRHDHPRCRGHLLVFRRALAYLKEKDSSGKWRETLLVQRPKQTHTQKRTYSYQHINVPCRSTQSLGVIKIPFDQMKDETFEAYIRRLSYMRAWAPTTKAGDELAGVRESAEGHFSQIDNAFHFKRIPASSRAAKHRLLLGMSFGKNIVAAARIRAGITSSDPPDG